MRLQAAVKEVLTVACWRDGAVCGYVDRCAMVLVTGAGTSSKAAANCITEGHSLKRAVLPQPLLLKPYLLRRTCNKIILHLRLIRNRSDSHDQPSSKTWTGFAWRFDQPTDAQQHPAYLKRWIRCSRCPHFSVCSVSRSALRLKMTLTTGSPIAQKAGVIAPPPPY
jgi:hypothetical protein